MLIPLDVERVLDGPHPTPAIWDFVAGLGLSCFEEKVLSVEGRTGRTALPPRLLISIWIYAYARGLFGPQHRAAMRLGAGPAIAHWPQSVNHRTLSDNRITHGEAVEQLVKQVLAVLLRRKLVTLERVTVDSAKVRAQVNK
ncbi:MAG: hypothetical protein LC114_04085 [Bryobacterales bacterium]|nr:hypothetical protein [Bryobacterales bacterium]